MRVLFDARVLGHTNYSGVHCYTREVYRALSRLTPLVQARPERSHKYLDHVWAHTVLPWRARAYDLLFCPATIAPFWKSAGTTLVMTLHDTAYLAYPHSVSPAFAAYYRLAIPRALAIAARVVTASEFSKAQILQHYPRVRDKIDVVHDGVDARKFAPHAPVQKEPFVLFVGSLHPRKNVARLIEAFLQICTGFPGMRLKIVGNHHAVFVLSAEEQAVIARARAHPQIDLLHGVDDAALVALYQKATLCVFPSVYEGFGLPPLEAMAAGTPVAASDAASIPEVCGDAAVYFDPIDVRAMADAMARALSDAALRERLVDKGRDRVAAHDWDQHARALMDIFTKAVGA